MPQTTRTSRLTTVLYGLIFVNLLLFMPLAQDRSASPFVQNLPMLVSVITFAVFACYLRQERKEQRKDRP